MNLYINTTKNNSKTIGLELRKENRVIGKKEVDAEYKQAEKLLVNINKLLIENKRNLNEIKGVYVKNSGGSFTSLRIGVITANTLCYALGIEINTLNKKSIKKSNNFKIVIPQYSKKPNITKKKINKF